MSLRTDHEGRNAWHFAAFGGELDVMQKILVFAEENLAREEMNVTCF